MSSEWSIVPAKRKRRRDNGDGEAVGLKRFKYVLFSKTTKQDELEYVDRMQRPDYSDSINVLVGSDEAPFMVHKAMVRVRSTFFDMACSKSWLEGQEKTVRLPEVSPYSFAVYCHWIYRDTVDDEYTDEDPPFETSRDDQAKYRCIICAYTLAEFLGDIRLKNKCMELLVKRQKRHPFTSSRGIAYGWTNTREDAPLRKWMVEAVASSTRKDWFSTNGIHDAGFPEELVSAVVERLIRFRDENKSRWPRAEDAAQYLECKTEKEDA